VEFNFFVYNSDAFGKNISNRVIPSFDLNILQAALSTVTSRNGFLKMIFLDEMVGCQMQWEKPVFVGSFASIFFFLPSLGLKLWGLLSYSSWQYKRWLVYPLLILLGYWVIRRRRRRLNRNSGDRDDHSLLFMAKQRLVKGEISLEEFRAIRQELDTE
jgi:uncharacterized membrane protein